MHRQRISSGTTFEELAGYSRALRVGNIVHVSGTTATDGADKIVGIGDSAAQTDFIIRKIEAALHEAGASLRRCRAHPHLPRAGRRLGSRLPRTRALLR